MNKLILLRLWFIIISNNAQLGIKNNINGGNHMGLLKAEVNFSILIVDDEKSNIDVLNEILKPYYKIYIAKSGTEAIKRAKMNQPDLILLDIIMPELNGFEILSILKEDDLTRDIPIIFITGLNNVDDEERGFFLGAVDYIKKPFNNSIVKARIKTHLQIVKQIRTIERLGLIDALTEIPNRRSFDNNIKSSWALANASRTPISLLTIDVDNFKTYNDKYGHPQGDVLLSSIAQIMKQSLFRSNDFIARIGGEEFIILLPDTDLNNAIQVAERVQKNVQMAEVVNSRDNSITSCTISVGVSSVYPNEESDVQSFIAKSDEMLYVAKGKGKNRVCF